MVIRMFCMEGQHPGPECDTNDERKVILPPGWRYVKVRMNEHGRLRYDPKSNFYACICPKCHVSGEPS